MPMCSAVRKSQKCRVTESSKTDSSDYHRETQRHGATLLRSHLDEYEKKKKSRTRSQISKGPFIKRCIPEYSALDIIAR